MITPPPPNEKFKAVGPGTQEGSPHHPKGLLFVTGEVMFSAARPDLRVAPSRTLMIVSCLTHGSHIAIVRRLAARRVRYTHAITADSQSCHNHVCLQYSIQLSPLSAARQNLQPGWRTLGVLGPVQQFGSSPCWIKSGGVFVPTVAQGNTT